MKSLAFRILMPTFVIMFLAGLVLYIFILRSVSDFADIHIKGDISDISSEVYRICDRNLNDLLMRGLSGDKKSVRIKKGLTLDTIENYTNQKQIRGFIIENGKELLKIGTLPLELSEIIEKTIKEHTVSPIKHTGERYYATHSHFEPWDWHLILIKDAATYSDLMYKVNCAYASAAVIFLVVLFSPFTSSTDISDTL